MTGAPPIRTWTWVDRVRVDGPRETRASKVETRRHVHEVFPDPELVPERIRSVLIQALAEFYARYGRTSPYAPRAEGARS